MGQMEDMRLFVQIVDAGSISKTADQLGIAKSAVSRRLSLLEDRYSTKLIARSPGNWEVTNTGRELYRRATNVVHDMDEIDGDFLSTSAVIEGPLTVSIPREFGVAHLTPHLIAFKEKYPQILLTMDFEDRKVDLSRENVDMVIRISGDREQGVEITRIGSVCHQLVASRSYIESSSRIECLADLHAHKILNFGTSRRASWTVNTGSGKRETFEFQPYLNSNNGMFLLSAVEEGLGIARLPEFVYRNSTRSAELIEVLPDVDFPELEIFLAYAEGRRLNRRMRLFAKEMEGACGNIA